MNETSSTDRMAGEPAYLYLPLAAHRVEDEASLLDYWQDVRARKWLVLGLAAALALLVAVVFIVIDPSYEAEVHMLHNTGSASSDSGSESSGDREGARSSSSTTTATSLLGTQEEAIAILQSRRFTDQLIQELNLLPVLYDDRWDAEKKTWKGKPPTLWEAYRKFNEKIRYVEVDKDGVTVMTITWKDPVQAAEWGNIQAKRLNEFLRNRDIVRTTKALDYLKREVGKTNVTELQQSLYSMIESYMKAATAANVTEEYAFTLIDPAVVPEEQVWTPVKRVVIVVFTFITGLILAALLAIFLGYLDRQRSHS